MVVAVAAGDTQPSSADVLDLFAGRLATFKHPKRVVWVEALPRNVMGIILKHEVRELLNDNEVVD